jgi:hypothetical protein
MRTFKLVLFQMKPQTAAPAPQQQTSNPYTLPPNPQMSPNAVMMHPSAFPYQMMWPPQMMFPSHHPALMQQQYPQHREQQQSDIIDLDRKESEEILIRRRLEARDAHLIKVCAKLLMTDCGTGRGRG